MMEKRVRELLTVVEEDGTYSGMIIGSGFLASHIEALKQAVEVGWCGCNRVIHAGDLSIIISVGQQGEMRKTIMGLYLCGIRLTAEKEA